MNKIMSLGETQFSNDIAGTTSTNGYLTLGQSAFGVISGQGGANGDQDWYVTYLEAGINYTASIIGAGGLFINGNSGQALSSAYFELYNQSGAFLGSIAPDADGDVFWNFTAPVSGFVYIAVSGLSAPDTGGYGVTVFTTPDDHGANLIGSGALPGATPITTAVVATGSLERPGDSDSFSFSAATGTRYFWSISSNVPDLFASLENVEMQNQGFNVLPGTNSGEFVAVQGGTFMLTLASNSFLQTGAYSVFLQGAYTTDKLLRVGTIVADALAGTGSDDEIWGWDGADTISGADGADLLVGNRDNDRIDGGAGFDFAAYGGNRSNYTIELLQDGSVLVRDNRLGGDGQDFVTNVEAFLFADQTLTYNDLLTGKVVTPPVVTPPSPPVDPYTGTDSGNTILGNSASNVIKGFGGNDVLKGGAGNDYLYGGLGNDKLYGNSGKDSFVFDTRPNKSTNKDTIVDFSVRDDTIRLDNEVFTKAGANGALKSGAFWASTSGKAHDANDRIIYDTDGGQLYYDADGSGKGAAVQLAQLSKNLMLTYKDFYIL